MKYFWLYVFTFIIIWLSCTYVVYLRDKSTQESFLNSPGSDSDSDKTSYDTSNFVEYHLSEDLLREQNKHKMQNMYVKGDDGKPVAIYMESTQTLPTYYTPGSFPYGASNYVPNYQDAIKLSKVDLDRSYGHEYSLVRPDGGLLTLKKMKSIEKPSYNGA